MKIPPKIGKNGFKPKRWLQESPIISVTSTGDDRRNTRKHSSRMRTARLLTTGVWGDVRGCAQECVSLPDPEADTPPIRCGQTDACINITLPQTSFADGNDISRLISRHMLARDITDKQISRLAT